jgi:hypothetical protein
MHLVGAMSGNPITSKLFWLVCAYCLGAAVPLVRQARAPLRSRATVPMPMARA